MRNFRAKLARAQQHLRNLECDVAEFFEQNVFAVAIERPALGLYVVQAVDPPVLPSTSWALVIGDCVHNLRCCLDYLAWELAGSNIADTETHPDLRDSRGVAATSRASPQKDSCPRA